MLHSGIGKRNGILKTALAVAVLMIAVVAVAEPFADRVAPQRLTLFVGQGEQRVRIEGRELDQVQTVVAYDTSNTGESLELPEVQARILHAEDDVMIVLLRADQQPPRGQRVQLALMFGHRGYLIPANVFEMEVR